MLRKKDFSTSKRMLSLFLAVLMLVSVFTCISAQGADFSKAEKSNDMPVSAVQSSSGTSSTFSWDNATVYFMLTDRFYNGDASNDHSYGRALDASGNAISGWDTADGTFHGGDFKGVTAKINEGYFDNLGVNAIWITAPYEQIHGYVDAGSDRANKAYYSYHGYWVLDYTETDKNMGTKEEFQELVDTAHEHGIRIVMDVVMNHAGYYTIADLENYNSDVLISGYESWRQTIGNASGYKNYINLTSSNWSKWWGSDWVRDDTISGYDRSGGNDQTNVLYDLPDFKIESSATVGIPEILKTKWTNEGTYTAKAAKYGTSGTVESYIVKWLAEWVETYGVDGFRCDTAKHIPTASWGKLKDACTTALRTWKANNPTKKLDDLDFWMTGENWGQDLSYGYNNYYTTGKFDSMINFAFGSAGGNNMPSSSSINSTYSSYASSLNSNDKYNLLTYISSHDDGLSSRSSSTSIYNGSALLLMPGGVQIFYGDETNRPLLSVGGDFAYRSDMNWNDVSTSATLQHWQKVGQFRNNHISVGAGSHTSLTASSGAAFARTYNKGNISDTVAAVIGASANTNVTVALGSVFSDGTVLKNAYDGTKAAVSGGNVTFNSGTNGTILIEPSITLGVTGDTVFEGSQTVTLNLKGADSATVTVDNGTPFTAVDGDQFTIGENTEIGGTVTITVTASNSDGETTKTFTFKKKDPNEAVKIYFDNSSYNWSKVNAYIYDESGESVIKNAEWPGVAMTKDSTTGYYVIEVPENLVNGQIIFNDGTNQYPASQQPGLSIGGASKLFAANYSWTDYEGPTEPTNPTNPTTPSNYITVKFHTSTWNNVNCYWWESTIDNISWPGRAMTNTGTTDNEGRKIFSIDVPKDAGNLIFNNGNSDSSIQTKDYTWSDQSIVEFYTDNETQNKQGNVLPYVSSVDPTVGTTITTFYIAKSMTANGVGSVVNAYCYNQAGVALCGAWPGTNITTGHESDKEGYYKIEIESDATTVNITVSNGSLQYPKNGTNIGVPAGSTAVLDSAGNLTVEEIPIDPHSKENAYSSGLWIDTKEDITDSNIALVRMDSSTNTLYVPAGVDLSNVTLYHKYSSLTINGTTVKSGDRVNLSVDSKGTKKSFTTSFGTMYVIQSESPAFYLSTAIDMLTYSGYGETKDSYVDSTGGTYLAVNEDGTTDTQGILSQVKGRGNSSWEASYKIFGKYAYNIKLDSKAKLFGMNSSKKWCLLANNADESMMRNMVVYNLAKEIGLDFSPMFKSVDLYDNGSYVGTYLVTEKVDVGKNNLVKINSLDDANEEANGNQAIEDIAHQETSDNLKYYVGNSGTLNNPDDITGGYLLEFELDERYGAEPSGFISNRGQEVVVKSPEYATKEEVEYISNLFNAAEAAVYSTNGYTTYNGKTVHYSDLIDVDSFAKMYLVQEFTENLDACATSFYIYKESDLLGDGKLHAAPVWDYDWTLGQYGNGKNINGNTLYPNNTSQWWARYKNIYKKATDHNGTRNFLSKLCENSSFWNLVKHQWNSLVKDKVQAEITNTDQYYADIKSSVSMNENKWGFIKNGYGSNRHSTDTITLWGSVDTGSTHSEAVVYLQDWMKARLSWMNQQSDLSGDPLLTCTETGINGTQDLTLSNGVFTYTGTVSKGSYNTTVTLNGSSISSKYDSSLNNLNGLVTVSQSGSSFNITLNSSCEFTIVYNTMTDKLYFTAEKRDTEFTVTYIAENNENIVKTISISASDEETMKSEIALEGPEIRSSYYDYLWKAENVVLDSVNNTAEVTAFAQPHLYTVKVYVGGEVKSENNYEYQTVEMNGDANPKGLAELKKADYGFGTSDNVKWCTKYVDPVSNAETEFILSTNSNYSFYVTRDIDIYISAFTGSVTSSYKTTILGTNYEKLSTTAGEKVRFKFSANVDTPSGLYNNVNGLGVVLVECDNKGAPLNGITETDLAENVEIVAKGGSVSGIHRYVKTGENIKPNSRGEFIYNITLSNNEANKTRYFRAYSLFVLDDDSIYVSDNSVIASIAFC